MPTINIPSERLDRLAVEAVERVFADMADETMVANGNVDLLDGSGADVFGHLDAGAEGFFTMAVGFMGDANGRVMLSIPLGGAERFALKLLDVPSLDWLGEDPGETLRDTLGELGNMLAGLVKGGLTKWYPKLMLTTPKVLVSRRLKIDTAAQSFRRQYLFTGLGARALLDVSFA